MKTALKCFALCLLISNSRGVAADVDYAKVATELAMFAAKVYAAMWVANKAVSLAEYANNKVAAVHPTVKTVADYTTTPALNFVKI